MGHTRLGTIPKTQKWNEVVRTVTAFGLSGEITADEAIGVIASRTLDAAEGALFLAARDPGVRYSFYLLTQIALASRTPHWEDALKRNGIDLAPHGNIFDLTAEFQYAVDRYIHANPGGTNDLSEMAQQAAGEAIASLAGAHTASLFGDSRDDLKNAIRTLSTQKGFGQLGQRFFGRFVARFLNFYLSRVTATALGKQQIRDLGDISQFNDDLWVHCDQSARIVRDFCGDWYSKTEFEQGIDLNNSSRFLGVAIKKLRKELQQQRAEL